MTLRDRLGVTLKEPLVHFLIVGLLLFGLFALRGQSVDPASRTITIDEPQVGRLVSGFAQTWQRPPTQAEIDGLIRDYIKEEVYYREGMRMGLDQDDTIIRRRIRSKMEFMASSAVENARPEDAVLQAILNKNPLKYVVDARYDFDQIYISAQDEKAGRARAGQVLAALKTGAAWHGVGDAISLPQSLDGADTTRIAREFGDEFVTALTGLKPGAWAGPIVSGFGFHLVRVRAIQSSAKPQLADVRQQVENDWRAATVRERDAKAYQALLSSYTIKIAKP